jgi:hypothetical protein
LDEFSASRCHCGSYTLVRENLAPIRLTAATSPAPAPQPPKARKATSWIMSHPDHLTRDARGQLAQSWPPAQNPHWPGQAMDVPMLD